MFSSSSLPNSPKLLIFSSFFSVFFLFMASSNHPCFFVEFIKAWRTILGYLMSTYEVIVSNDQMIQKVKTLLETYVPPPTLPAKHPFHADYDEFVLTFPHGAEVFKRNAAIILQHDALECELCCLTHELFTANAFYQDLVSLKPSLNEARTRANKLVDELSCRMKTPKERSWTSTPTLSSLEYEIGQTYDRNMRNSSFSFSQSLVPAVEDVETAMES